jgi:hypothetical protein
LSPKARRTDINDGRLCHALAIRKFIMQPNATSFGMA